MKANRHSGRSPVVEHTLLLKQEADRVAHEGDTSVAADRHGGRRPAVGHTLLLMREADRLAHGGDMSVTADSNRGCRYVMGRTLLPMQDADRLAHEGDASVSADSHGERTADGSCGAHVAADAERRQIGVRRRHFQSGRWAAVVGAFLLLMQNADRLTHEGDTSVAAGNPGEHCPVVERTLLLMQTAGRLAHGGDTPVAADSRGERRHVVGRTLLLTQDADRLAHGGDTIVKADRHGGRRPVVGHVTADAGRRQVDAWRRYFHDSEQPQGAMPRYGHTLLLTQDADRLAHGGDTSVTANSHSGQCPVVGRVYC